MKEFDVNKQLLLHGKGRLLHMLRQADRPSPFVKSVLSASRVPIHLGYMRDPCHLFQMYGASLACHTGHNCYRRCC